MLESIKQSRNALVALADLARNHGRDQSASFFQTSKVRLLIMKKQCFIHFRSVLLDLSDGQN